MLLQGASSRSTAGSSARWGAGRNSSASHLEVVARPEHREIERERESVCEVALQNVRSCSIYRPIPWWGRTLARESGPRNATCHCVRPNPYRTSRYHRIGTRACALGFFDGSCPSCRHSRRMQRFGSPLCGLSLIPVCFYSHPVSMKTRSFTYIMCFRNVC